MRKGLFYGPFFVRGVCGRALCKERLSLVRARSVPPDNGAKARLAKP